ncbi:MAG: hypothetical protein AB9891_12770 [Anaerolineaceae bacterium]
MEDFHGFSTGRLSSPCLELVYLREAGPRIVSLCFNGSKNLLADLPHITIPTPFGDFHYLGGHRLWHAPEAMPRSYIPDENNLIATELSDGVLLDGKTEVGTGIHKSIAVHLDPDGPKVELIHTLTNEGLWEVELAPWALTMFRLGGVVIIPTQTESPDVESLLPDRRLALWPYSRVTDPRLHMEDAFIFLEARPDHPAFKIGAFNPRGWMGYWLDGILFKKSFEIIPGGVYPDHACTSETYSDSEFVELETLGPLAKIVPGASVQLVETWELFERLDQPFIPTRAVELIHELGL